MFRINRLFTSYLSPSKRDFNAFRAFLFSSSLYALSFAYRLDALNGICWGKFHGKGLKSKTFHQTCVIILCSVVVRRGCVKAKGIGYESSLARTHPIFFFFLLLLLLFFICLFVSFVFKNIYIFSFPHWLLSPYFLLLVLYL